MTAMEPNEGARRRSGVHGRRSLAGVVGVVLLAVLLATPAAARQAEGVTIEDVELGDKTLTRVDYGDDLADAYLYATGDAVILLHTSSAELAEAGAAALP